MRQPINLNVLQANTDGNTTLPLEDAGRDFGDATVMFGGLEGHLVRAIESAPYVIGCVAWLTNRRILSALASRKGVSIVVQKEDFLRPDVKTTAGWQGRLRAAYGALRAPSRRELPGVARELSTGSQCDHEAIRCMGLAGRRGETSPRMHHKFVVLCDYEPHLTGGFGKILPRAVWTGSFNFTENAVSSRENAILIRNGAVAEAYAHEFANILALSESLDWDTPWVAPEFRIGT